MTTRKWYLSQALSSYRGLLKVIGELSEEEVLACLELESGTQRRQSVLDCLTKRAVRLYSIRLQEKYHGKST